jgi:hypothetical protein
VSGGSSLPPVGLSVTGIPRSGQGWDPNPLLDQEEMEMLWDAVL